jgi:hypothetical protein
MHTGCRQKPATWYKNNLRGEFSFYNLGNLTLTI